MTDTDDGSTMTDTDDGSTTTDTDDGNTTGRETSERDTDDRDTGDRAADDRDTTDRPSSKVARQIEAYGLTGLGAEMEARWTSDGDDRMSLRDLADYFNRQLLEAALDDADGGSLEGGGRGALEADVDTIYERLTDDDVTGGVRAETRTRLERTGVDVDELEDAFVTYQTVHSYLTDYREAEYERLSDEEKIEKDVESIQRLTSRTLSVTEDRVASLRDTDRIDAGEFEVLLNLQVLCRECGRQYPADEFLRQGGCDCEGAG